jgi:hypothetical protein
MLDRPVMADNSPPLKRFSLLEHVRFPAESGLNIQLALAVLRAA